LITDQDRECFREKGFVALAAVIPASMIERVNAHLSTVTESALDLEYSVPNVNLECPGGGFLGQTGRVKSYRGVLRAMFHLEERDPFFADLGDKSDFYRHVVSALVAGHRPRLLSVNYWGKPAAVGSAQPWHQDLAYIPPVQRTSYNGALTCWIALDPARVENGCLEFYPGSHRSGDLPHVGSADAADGEQIRLEVSRLFPGLQPTPVELDPGAAVFFDGRVVHGSRVNTSSVPRRAISFSYIY